MKTHDETPETVSKLQAEVQRFENAISEILGHPHKAVTIMHKTMEEGVGCEGVAILTTEVPIHLLMHIMKGGYEAAMMYAILQEAENRPPPGTTVQ